MMLHKKFIKSAIVMAGVFIVAYAQSTSFLVQPGCFYRLTEISDPEVADSLFTTADSSFKPEYDNGNRAICKGIWVASGSPSGYVCVHPNFRSDTTARYLIKIDSTLDAGYPIPFIFDKIFKSGTTIPLDSIGYFPDAGR